MAGDHQPRPQSEIARLIYLPAHRQLNLFRRRKLSPVDVLEAQIEQTRRVNPLINAVTFEHFRQAKAAARKSEARYRRDRALPLDGLTVAIKDEFGRKGWKTTAGTKAVRAQTEQDDHPLIRKLLATGAVLHMQTTTPEFYLLPVTWSLRWGVTRNPWNLHFTPGGSSGGAAAALAAGMATLAIGSDMGGSIRIPAALTGLYGFNPPALRNAAAAKEALLIHASDGPLARNFGDLILLQNVLAGPAGDAPAVLPKLTLPRRYPSIRGWKIALSMDQGWASVPPDVKRNTMAAAALLRKAGATIEAVNLRLGMDGTDIRQAIEKALFSTAIGGELAEVARAKLTTYGRRFARLASQMTPRDANSASEDAVRVHEALARAVFQRGYKALICPTTATTDVAADYDPTRGRLQINGRPVDPYVGWFLTSIFNLCNWLPVINVPTGRADNGVPTGLQIVAGAYRDLDAAAVAFAYAQHAPRLFEGGLMPAFHHEAS
jgi:Asp-tRNA(Asn)/Glu-tRNA(Gln) amidotransferase A subunit family amidase